MTVYWRVLKYAKPYLRYLGFSLLASILYSLFSAVSIYLLIPLLETLFKQDPKVAASASRSGSLVPSWLLDAKDWAVDQFQNFVFTGTTRESLFRIVMVILVAFLFKNLFGYIQSMLTTYVEQAMGRDIRGSLYRHLHQLPLSYFTGERTGNLISRIMNDVTVVNSGISASIYTLIREPLLIMAYLTICLLISWQLTLLAFVVFPLVLLIITWVGKRVRRESGKIQERLADVTSVLYETISGVKVVKAFGMESFENKKFAREIQRHFRTVVNIAGIRNLASPTTEFLTAVGGGAIIWYGGLEVLANESMKASEFLGFLFAMFQLMPPIKEISSVNNRIQEASAAGARVFSILDTEPNIKDAPNPVAVSSFEKEIVIENLCFGYSSDTLVLMDISTVIRKGEVVAIVGPSGSGKSTLVDLVPRFYDVTEGSIRIDGVDVRQISIESLRSLIGVVTQETILFNDSVRNNIAYGRPEVPDEKLVEAAKAANAHRFIMNLSDGYETMIGDRGIKLSGGERQRLSLARAILKNPPILILDEATSALDTESELLVQEAIEKLMKGRTSIVIAHRLSTIQHADTIMVIEGGRIREVGKHADLVNEQGSLYKKLYDMQFRA
ncbi:MAG TPA: ABC transporter ATP-binding protein [Bacteroidota bacterium]